MRDPRIDPQPGDVLTKNGVSIQVHFVEKGVVYCGPYVDGKTRFGGVRMPLEEFRQECATLADYQRFEALGKEVTDDPQEGD